MGIWSWLFPTDEDRLRRAREEMAAGRYDKARAGLLHCQAPEAEALYDACSAKLEAKDKQNIKQQLAAGGFHGWKIEITAKGRKLKVELEALVAEELERGGVDLDMPDIDQKAFKAAVGRAQRRVRNAHVREAAGVRLVPVVDGELARRLGAR